MKKLLILILAVLLLSGCGNQEPMPTAVPTTEATGETVTVSPTEPTTAPTTAPTTTPTTAPTVESTETTVPVLSPELWRPSSEQLSYKEYFSQEQWFDWQETVSWIVAGENGAHRFTLNTGLMLTVTGDAFSESYLVPFSQATLEKYGNPLFLGTDGRIACFVNETQIVSIDLETGEDTVLVTAEKLQDVYFMGGSVLYYIRYEYGNPVICRFYIPEHRENVIRHLEESWHRIQLKRPNSNLGKIEWESYNPEMVALTQAELANPDSKYKSMDFSGVSYLWEEEDVFADPYLPSLLVLFEAIQADTGVPAMRKGSLDCRTGEYVEVTGKLNNGCCYGSIFPHDHYVEEYTELPVPKPINSEPQSYSVEELPQDWVALVYAGGSRLISEKGYFITDENTVVFLPDDGGGPEIVYTAQFGRLRDPHFQKLNGMGDTEWLCLLDGNRIVAVDTENRVYKVLIRNNYLIGCMDWFDGRIFFEIKHGMYYQGYIYNPETGSLEPKRIL